VHEDIEYVYPHIVIYHENCSLPSSACSENDVTIFVLFYQPLDTSLQVTKPVFIHRLIRFSVKTDDFRLDNLDTRLVIDL
jgi:hypothetical protein